MATIYEVTVDINQGNASTATKDTLVEKFEQLVSEINMTLNDANIWVTDVSVQ